MSCIILKALPAPIETSKKKRGGRRARKMKERLGITEMRKTANRMNFGDVSSRELKVTCCLCIDVQRIFLSNPFRHSYEYLIWTQHVLLDKSYKSLTRQFGSRPLFVGTPPKSLLLILVKCPLCRHVTHFPFSH